MGKLKLEAETSSFLYKEASEQTSKTFATI